MMEPTRIEAKTITYTWPIVELHSEEELKKLANIFDRPILVQRYNLYDDKGEEEKEETIDHFVLYESVAYLFRQKIEPEKKDE